jgi:hypothetical protein
MSLFRRMGSSLKSEISWAKKYISYEYKNKEKKNTPPGFRWGQVVFVQYLKPRKMN